MAEFPALPLFTDAYIADTRHLTAAQHGAYLLLLMMAWRLPDCALPNDDEILARWASMDLRTWRRNKDVVLSFWKLGADTKWRQGRLSDERQMADDKRSKNAAAGRASALKRHKKVSTNVQQEGNVNPTNPNPNPVEEKSSLKTTPKEIRGTRLPDDFTPDATCEAVADEMLFTKAQSQAEFDKFVDYWRSVPGAKGRKLDWQATFRNWLRNAKPGTINGKHSQTPSRLDKYAEFRAINEARRARERGESGDEGAGELPGLRPS